MTEGSRLQPVVSNQSMVLFSSAEVLTPLPIPIPSILPSWALFYPCLSLRITRAPPSGRRSSTPYSPRTAAIRPHWSPSLMSFLRVYPLLPTACLETESSSGGHSVFRHTGRHSLSAFRSYDRLPGHCCIAPAFSGLAQQGSRHLFLLHTRRTNGTRGSQLQPGDCLPALLSVVHASLCQHTHYLCRRCRDVYTAAQK